MIVCKNHGIIIVSETRRYNKQLGGISMIYTCNYLSPLGEILLAADEAGLTGLWFVGQKYFANTLPEEHIPQETEILTEAKAWLDVVFLRQSTALYSAPSSRRFRIPSGSMADFIADSLRTDHHIRRNCTQNEQTEKCIPYVCPGSRRCSRT